MPPVKKNKKMAKNAKPAEEPIETPVVSAQLAKKIKKKKQKQPIKKEERGVVFLRRLPHGFFEEQLKNYFEQFGDVTRLRLARSTNTGGSKGYAFVEFKYPEVAQVAADTMDNYLMFHRIVKAKYIPPDQQKYNYFKSKVRKVVNKAGKSIYVSGKTAIMNKKVKEYNNWTPEAFQKRTAANIKKLDKLQEKYAHLGINFGDFAIKPKLVDASTVAAAEGDHEEIEASQPGNLLLINKPKRNEKKSKKTAKKIELKQLLENTLPEEDSQDDEDFDIEAANESDESNEESYGFDLGSDASESEDNEIKDNFKGKSQKVDLLDNLIRRKKGGIKKMGKKSLKDTKVASSASASIAAFKDALKKSVVQELAKGGNVKKMKKSDLKNSTQKEAGNNKQIKKNNKKKMSA